MLFLFFLGQGEAVASTPAVEVFTGVYVDTRRRRRRSYAPFRG